MVTSTKSIDSLQTELIGEFEFFTDWTEKYEYIIELGKSMEKLDERYKIDENLIKGCQSKVWLHGEFINGKVIFKAESDAIITKGLISMIIRVFSGHTPAEIAQANLAFIDKIGLKEHLSPTRSNGLLSMVKQIKFYALAFQAKQ